MSTGATRNLTLNPHTNGDVYTSLDCYDIEYIGRIDTEGDWHPAENCDWTENDVRAEIIRLMDDPDNQEWSWPTEQLVFAGRA